MDTLLEVQMCAYKLLGAELNINFKVYFYWVTVSKPPSRGGDVICNMNRRKETKNKIKNRVMLGLLMFNFRRMEIAKVARR